MALSGIYAFSQPFSIEIIGLHALSGFVFIAVVVGHILNNIVPLKKYFKHGTAMAVGLAVALIHRTLLLPTSTHQGCSWI